MEEEVGYGCWAGVEALEVVFAVGVARWKTCDDVG